MRAGSVVRAEWPTEAAVIGDLITAAFAAAPHRGGNEATIVTGLREAGDLALSLVATDAARIIGHVAFSPVSVSNGAMGWFGLGPVAVLPEVQRQGIGGKLVRDGLVKLRELGAAGVVVLGDPAYYGRFGFKADPALVYPGAAPAHFQALAFTGSVPSGTVRYAAAFG